MADEQNIALATTTTPNAETAGQDGGIDGSCCTVPPDDDPGPVKG